ncbi:MAG: DNA repair protein RadC, partial [Ruminococcaceae bacterium]|nr:DNA repair protein RadC [Oscillospiraceae bacterium]
ISTIPATIAESVAATIATTSTDNPGLTADAVPFTAPEPETKAGTKSDIRYTMKQIPDSERPSERFCALGPAALTDAELLAIIIRNGNRNSNALQLAQNLIINASGGKGGLDFLQECSLEELMSHTGIGRVRAIQLKAIIEIAARAGAGARKPRETIRTPQDASRLVETEMANLPREELRAVLMDIRNRVIRVIRIAEGGLSSSVICPRDLFREAVRANAAALILAHNHPSGDPSPSTEDIETTRRFVDMGDLMGVKVVDHIIVARGGFTSLKQQGSI